MGSDAFRCVVTGQGGITIDTRRAVHGRTQRESLRIVRGLASVWGRLRTFCWDELESIAVAIGPRYGPMILFAAATVSARRSGSRSRNATSTAPLGHPKRAEDPEDGGEHPRGAASDRSRRSTGSETSMARRCSCPASAAAISTSTTPAVHGHLARDGGEHAIKLLDG